MYKKLKSGKGMRKAILLLVISSLIILPLANVLAYSTNYQYTGQEKDPTGLYNYGQRQYDPNVGRFTQPDPVSRYITDPQKLKQATGQDLQEFLKNPQALNEYSYTQNNPIKYVDPTGETIVDVIRGKQSLPAYQLEVGDGAEVAYHSNGVWKTALDHPVLTVGVVSFGTPLIAAGISALFYGTSFLSALGLAGAPVVNQATQVVQKIGNLDKLETLEKASSAVDKLNSLSKLTGQSVDQILKLANKSETVLTDLRANNSGNVNVFIQNPVNSAKLIRVTLDPTLNKIISAGIDRISQVENWINNGSLIRLNK